MQDVDAMKKSREYPNKSMSWRRMLQLRSLRQQGVPCDACVKSASRKRSQMLSYHVCIEA